MDEKARARFNRIWDMAQTDREYFRLGEENRTLEKQYFAILDTLPVDTQDQIQDILMNCEGMSWRMLEVACEKMIFPEEK